jgi:8-amino-7-oxononanoate synthase
MADPLDSIRAELDALADAGLRRTPRTVDGPQGPELMIEGRRVANFCSNDYLGLASHPAVIEALCAGARIGGVGAGASRLITGSVEPHVALESAIRSWLGTERALLFNSGYQANIGIVSALVGPGDAVFSDALNHASLIDGCRQSRATVHVYPHLDLAELERALSVTTARRKLVISESLFSMDGDTANVAELRRISRTHGALLVIDEAHAVGAFGESGRGLVAAHQADAVVGTLGKAFGSFGAFVAGRVALVELALQKARSFVFSTALPGAVSAASLASLRLVVAADDRRAQLIENIARLRAGLGELGLAASQTQIQPIAVRGGDPRIAVELAELLYNEGIFAQAIRPPTVPRGTARLRVTVRSDHRAEQIDHLVARLSAHRDLLP